MVTVLR